MESALEDTGFDNIMGTMRKSIPPESPEDEENQIGEELLTIDHSRLVAILWGVCKNQQTALKLLSTRVEALEAPKKRQSRVKHETDQVSERILLR